MILHYLICIKEQPSIVSDQRGVRCHLNTSQPILLPLEKSFPFTFTIPNKPHFVYLTLGRRGKNKVSSASTGLLSRKKINWGKKKTQLTVESATKRTGFKRYLIHAEWISSTGRKVNTTAQQWLSKQMSFCTVDKKWDLKTLIFCFKLVPQLQKETLMTDVAARMDQQGRCGVHWELQEGMNSFWWCINSETFVHLNVTSINSPGSSSCQEGKTARFTESAAIAGRLSQHREGKTAATICHPGFLQVSAGMKIWKPWSQTI